MGVLKDYLCSHHGVFESREPKCPIKFCTGELSVIFLQPVAIKSERTKANDRNLKQLAIDFDMTDIKSTREGEHQDGYLKRKNKLSDKEFAHATEAMETNNRIQQQQNPEPVYRHGGEQAVWGGVGNIGIKSVIDGQFKPVRDEAVSVMPNQASPTGRLRGPTAGAGTMVDHENLKVT